MTSRFVSPGHGRKRRQTTDLETARFGREMCRLACELNTQLLVLFVLCGYVPASRKRVLLVSEYLQRCREGFWKHGG